MTVYFYIPACSKCFHMVTFNLILNPVKQGLNDPHFMEGGTEAQTGHVRPQATQLASGRRQI